MLQPRFIFVLMVFVTTLSGLLFGFETGVIAGVLQFVRIKFHASVFELEIIVSALLLGALAGAAFSGRLADYMGRRQILILTALIYIVGTIFVALADGVGVMSVGRFITGLAVGIASYAAPLFIAEIAPTADRGRWVLFNGMAITGGEALAYCINYFFAPAGAWRTMIAVGIIPACCLLLGMLFLPNSPRWLAVKGKYSQALRDSLKFGGEKIKQKKQILTPQLADSVWNILADPKLLRVLIIGVGLGIFQQFVGINTILYYGPFIFAVMGLKAISPQILGTLGLGLVNFFTTIITIFLVDRVGRRRLLLVGTFIAFFSLLWLGIFSSPKSVSTIPSFWKIAAQGVCLVTYIVGYCIGLGSLFWLIIAEIFPVSIRGRCMSVVTAAQWGANFLVAVSFLSILNGLGMRYSFWLYTIMNGLAFLFIKYFVPETAGLSLEYIESQVISDKPLSRWKKSSSIK